jgi:hypothetical protein
VTLTAVVGALLVLAIAAGRDADASPAPPAAQMHMSHAAGGAAITPRQLAFRNDMRKLWEDHVTWTRLAIISLTTGSADTSATVARLLRNQTDIGNAVAPYYGKAGGKALTGLLRQHILIAADLIAAAKAGDQDAVTAEQKRWVANADDIAAFLNKANPRYWKLGEMKSMMHEHLTLTTNEVVARLQARWAADIAAYDRIHRQILGMADMLSTGIEKQFPARFR